MELEKLKTENAKVHVERYLYGKNGQKKEKKYILENYMGIIMKK